MFSARGNAINTLSYFKECSANNNDNRDISNNDINKEHNEYKLGSGDQERTGPISAGQFNRSSQDGQFRTGQVRMGLIC